MSEHRLRNLLFLAFTLIFIGYFMVWLPHAAAGLRFIGIEMGEEAKFLAYRERSLFYVPPVTLALMLIFLSTRWSNRRWQTWAMRTGAVAVSLLAFPAIEAIGMEAAEWLWRVVMIGLVLLVAALSPLLRDTPPWLPWLFIHFSAIAGAALPTWAFLEMRRIFSVLLQENVGVGPGVWLSLTGHLLVLALSAVQLRRQAPIIEWSRNTS